MLNSEICMFLQQPIFYMKAFTGLKQIPKREVH